MAFVVRSLRPVLGLTWLVAAMLLVGCASPYVDGGLPDADPARFRRADPPHPVQVLFEFRTRGVPNARATDSLKARALEQVRSSGIFSGASETPVAGGALLSITIDNVPLDDQAAAKGFATGLTLGLVGNQVSDGYVCSARYSGPDAAPPFVKETRHAIHTTIGAKGPPPNAIKTSGFAEAANVMLRQVIGNLLLAVSTDPAFK